MSRAEQVKQGKADGRGGAGTAAYRRVGRVHVVMPCEDAAWLGSAAAGRVTGCSCRWLPQAALWQAAPGLVPARRVRKRPTSGQAGASKEEGAPPTTPLLLVCRFLSAAERGRRAEDVCGCVWVPHDHPRSHPRACFSCLACGGRHLPEEKPSVPRKDGTQPKPNVARVAASS